MGNFEENRKTKEETRKKNDVSRKKMAGYFFDLSKLSFAGMVIGGITPLLSNLSDSANWITAVGGIISTYGFAFFANRILK